MYLAHSTPMSEDVKNKLLFYALKWYQYTKEIDLPQNIKFEEPQKVLDSINGGKVNVTVKNFDGLLQWAEKELIKE